MTFRNFYACSVAQEEAIRLVLVMSVYHSKCFR